MSVLRLWRWLAVPLVVAYATGVTATLEGRERCPEFSSPTPAAPHLCHSHLGPDAKYRVSDTGARSIPPPDTEAIQERHATLRLANFHLSLVDATF